jgi:hypothetical protein
MGALRLFRRSQEKRGLAHRKIHKYVTEKKLSGFSKTLIEKAELQKDWTRTICEWRKS